MSAHEPMVNGEPAWSHIMDTADRNGAILTDGNVVKKSWASVLGGSLPIRDNNNVLEVTLEKDSRGSFIVTESDCFNLLRRLGLDPRPGIDVEGVQICPQGKRVSSLSQEKK